MCVYIYIYIYTIIIIIINTTNANNNHNNVELQAGRLRRSTPSAPRDERTGIIMSSSMSIIHIYIYICTHAYISLSLYIYIYIHTYIHMLQRPVACFMAVVCFLPSRFDVFHGCCASLRLSFSSICFLCCLDTFLRSRTTKTTWKCQKAVPPRNYEHSSLLHLQSSEGKCTMSRKIEPSAGHSTGAEVARFMEVARLVPSGT